MVLLKMKARRGRKSSKKSSKVVASKVWVKKQLNSRSEKKFCDSTVTNTGVTTTGTTTYLSGIAQGNTAIQRIGDTVLYKSIRIKGTIIVGDTTNILRLILFRWKAKTDITLPTIANILQVGSGSAQGVFSPLINDLRDQFIVLHDKLYPVNTNGTASGTQHLFSIVKKLNVKAEYITTNSTFQSNGLFLLAVTDSAVLPNPGITWYSRISFIDS